MFFNYGYKYKKKVVVNTQKKTNTKKTITSNKNNVRVPRTHFGNTLTEAEFFGMFRSIFRLKWMLSPVRKEVLKKAKTKIGYICNECKKPYPKYNVEVNHIEGCGSLKSYSDMGVFCEKLFTDDISKLEVLCKECHKEETKKQKNYN